uniref:Rap-GAP domain-containing protein n=1 Tax=Romanomermis culicivorax TaxID=13658 RepID=A0A915KHD8_ROMCU
MHEIVPASCLGPLPTAARMAKVLREEISVEKFHPVLFPKGSDMILNYDEHVLVSNYKFGVIYQRFGQTTEEELFNNVGGSAAFDEFLTILGDKVQLKNFPGYRGGLDTLNDQTGNYSIYTKYKDNSNWKMNTIVGEEEQ